MNNGLDCGYPTICFFYFLILVVPVVDSCEAEGHVRWGDDR